MKPYLWMVDFTPQREWIEGKGLLLWLAFFCTELGAGAYLVSLFVGYPGGMAAGWFICALVGGGLHVAYLGRPERAWRALLRPNKSELSRGLIVTFLFLSIGAAHLAIHHSWANGAPLILDVIVGACAAAVVMHGFMVLNSMASVPFWSAAAGPVLALASGVWLGFQVTLMTALAMGQDGVIARLEPTAPWVAGIYGLMMLYAFWTAGHGTPASKAAMRELRGGRLAPLFYLGVLSMALVIPTVITFVIYFQAGPALGLLLAIRALSLLLGDMALRYSIHKAARYYPLIDSNVLSLRLSQGS